MSRKKTHKEFVTEVEEKYPNQFIFLSQYNGRLERIKVKCVKCGREWEPRAKDILNGYGCKICNGRLTHNEFMERVRKRNNKNITIVGEYISSEHLIKVKCNECDYQWKTKPQNIIQNHGCPKCGNSLKKTTETFSHELEEKYPGKYTVVGEYINCNTKITIKCNICNYTWDVMPSSLLHNGGCPNCFKIQQSSIVRQSKLNTENSFYSKANDVLKQEWQYCIDFPELTMHDFSYGSRAMMHWKCSMCGYEWDTTSNNRMNGHGCPSCANKKKRTHEEFIDEISDMLDRIEIISEYQSIDKTIKVKCLICGHEWEPLAGSLIRGHGCKMCAYRNNKSNLQTLVEEYISDKYNVNISHEYECKLQCVNPKTNRLLPYDNELEIFNKKLIIEVHGIQHYKTDGFVKKSAQNLGVSEQYLFEYNKWKDEFKKQYALDNGYEYLEVPYWTEKDSSYQELIDNKIKTLQKGN